MTRIRTWIGLCLLLLGTAGCQPLEPPKDPIAWAWSYQAGDYIRSKPAVDGKIVYIGADDNHLHAVDANTGEGLWNHETADNVTSAAATNDDGVYFASWDGGIYALDAAGDPRWTFQTEDWVSATPLLHDNLLYVGSQDGVFYALDADNGDPIWRFETTGRIENSAAIAGDLVIFTASDGYVHALDLKTGQRRWFYHLAGISNAPPVVAGNQIYISSLNRSLTTLEANSGKARWIFTADAPIGATPAVSDDVVYVGADDGMVFALHAESGQPLWQHATGEMIRSTPALWHELLFVGTNGGNLYALDSTSGTPRWDYRLGGAITQGPTISADRLYVGSTLSQLHAFDLSADVLSDLQPDSTTKTQKAANPDAECVGAMPTITEYDRLWTAQAVMPDIDALRTVRDVIALRPLSPAAYHAHVILARYYAGQEAPAAEDAYRSALDLDDNVALRLELANYLEAVGDHEAAYAEYYSLLSRQPDAFVGMRRTGTDPLQVAADLNSMLFYTDALETLRDVDAAEAVPLRAEAYMGLGRHGEAATAYRDHLRSYPDDEEVRMGLALARAWLGNGEAALDLYSTVDTPESRRRQAQLLELEEPDLALELYLDSPDPAAWWAATEMLESQARFTETLFIYERIAQAETQYADDAAYRLYTLGQRLGNADAQDKGLTLLNRFGLNWLAHRSKNEPLQIEAAPSIALDHVLAEKVTALESIGCHDLARLELLFAARFRSAPETDLATAQALSERGDIREAQRIAERYINEHDSAPLDFWRLSYPRPYAETVTAAAAAYGVDPLLIWAVMREESRFDPDARSHADARGLMQVIPATQTWIAEALGEAQAPGDAYVPATSIRMAAWLLNFLTDYFGGDLELAIPAYNAGAGSVDSWLADARVEDRDDLLRWIGYNETRLYLKRVALSYQIYRSLYQTD